MKKQWNKDIHDRLKDFPKKAPEGLLNDIQSEILHRGLSPAVMPRKNKRIFLRIASAAAVLLILLGISHLWERQPIVHPEEHIFVPTTEEAIPPIFAEEEDEQESIPTTAVIRKVMAEAQMPISHSDTLATPKEEAPSETKKEKNQENMQEEQKKGVDEQPAVPTREERKKSFTPIRRKTSSFALGAYYSGLVAQSGFSSNEYCNINASSPSVPDDNNPSDSTAVSSRAFSRSRSDNGVKHHLPIRVGISFRYCLDEHWSIQSGLTYSYLATDITRNDYQKKQQALHYIGIPIQIGYQVWENKHFKSYLAAGTQVEKLVSGKVMTHYWGGNNLQANTTERISDKRLLFSALASIGAEYALTPSLSIYAEPGIHYYFKNGNGLETHYNDQPLNFNITVGIRFHWKR